MQAVLLYAIKVSAISGILLCYYWLALRNKRFHYYNRFYLLMSVMFSLLLPLLNLNWIAWHSDNDKAIQLLQVITIAGGEHEIDGGISNAFNWTKFATLLLVCVSAFLLVRLIVSIIKIYKLKKAYPNTRTTDFDFVQTNLQQAPFSFFKNLFWREDIDMKSATGEQILAHEITHIKQKHSWDKLFIQVLLVLFWMNPFFWLIRKELYLIHEFIADEKAVANNDVTAFVNMLLTSSFGKNVFAPAQSFSYSPIKRRLIMLTNKNSMRFSYLRRLLVLPLLAVVLGLFAFKLQKENRFNAGAAEPFTLIIDAGHGGKDAGAIGINSIQEKDVALSIAKKIKDLAPAYNIDVKLTRDADVYQSPREKAILANQLGGNAFISIHINAQNEEEKNTSGVDVLVSDKNKSFEQSKVLGSAIIEKVNSDFTVNKPLMQRKTAIWVLTASETPALLIECGFIDNKTDVAMLQDDARIKVLAKRILEGVAAFANQKVIKVEDVLLEPNGNITSLNASDNNVVQKNIETKAEASASKDSALFVIDGKISTAAEANKLDPKNIESINVLKDKHATDKYGEKGKNGVVEITTKKVEVLEKEIELSSAAVATDSIVAPQATRANN